VLELQITSNNLAKALKELPQQLERELRLASKRVAVKVEKEAKSKHRFTTRTGRLVKSIKGYGSASVSDSSITKKKLDTEVRIVLHNEGHPLGTDYGKYVHEGHGSWSPDRFVFDAIERNKKRIINAWDEAIEKVAKGF